MKKFLSNLLFLSLLIVSSSAFSSSLMEFSQGAPEGAEEIITASGDVYQNFVPFNAGTSENSAQQLMSGSWWDNGPGAGTLTSQYQLFYSSILSSSSFASGYMSKINYQWSGSFNGWANVHVYLLIVHPTTGVIIANAEVTSATSGSLTPPANSYPANYAIAYGYIVDRAPKLTIFNGPTFGTVSVTVIY